MNITEILYLRNMPVRSSHKARDLGKTSKNTPTKLYSIALQSYKIPIFCKPKLLVIEYLHFSCIED